MAKPQVADPKTGEITVVHGSGREMTPPKLKQITPISLLTGVNPLAVNLRDHPELSGQYVVIVAAKWKKSTLGGHSDTFVIFDAYVCVEGEEIKKEQLQRFITGAENVQGRIADAEMLAGDGSPYPMSGTLRCSKGGQAWFLD